MHQIAYTARLVFAFANKSPLVAQLDRAPGFEPGCREFESLRAGHLLQDDSIKSISYRSRSWLLLLSVAPLACIFLIRAR
jgi:hypothetical protein